MARLNEAPQPAAESIDALKRRFVRQNREIARANSTQSIRIRNLENEVSRLLSENVSLREQIIKLHYEIEKNTSQSIQDNVDIVKAKLEAKLKELGGLVKELGEVQKIAGKSRAYKRKSTSQASPKRSPDQRNWKNALSLSEATGGADGRLPPIVEDKYYPRRTMDAEELLEVFTDTANVTDSPDLGPPPIAHFDEGDPIKYDPKTEKDASRGPSEPIEDSHVKLPANLETRKRRRESSHHREIEDQKTSAKANQEATSKDLGTNVGQPLKSGAKRKLNMRDEEDQAVRSDDQEKDMFQFNRKTGDARGSDTTTAKPIIGRTSKHAKDQVNQSTAGSVQTRKDKVTEVPAVTTATNRKALIPKSVNASPVRISSNGKDKIAEVKDDLAKIVRERNRLKEKVQSGKLAAPTKDQDSATSATAATKSTGPIPETPAPPANDLFSPVSSEPSGARAESRDTPPPPDLGPDMGTGSFGRASRRPKGAVNYAQPNLRDKMRRPTKELVDAVGAEERLRQANLTRTGTEAADSVISKQEDIGDAMPPWKTNDPKEGHRIREEPTSPLSNKTGGSAIDLPGTVVTDRRRRSVAPARNDDIDEPSKPSSASSAIIALTGGSHKLRRREEDESSASTTEDRTNEPTERPSIYDFSSSSPPDHGGNASDNEGKGSSSKPTRSSRRHSSVPASTAQASGSLSISRRRESRRESLLSGRRDEGAGKSDDSQLARTMSVLTLGTACEQASLGRGERAASRRRSMML